MIVTEAQAAERRCPQRSYMGEPHGFCLASMCMAWRFGPPIMEEAQSNDGRPAGEGWKHLGAFTWTRRTANPRGYCGLAGNPGESP